MTLPPCDESVDATTIASIPSVAEDQMASASRWSCRVGQTGRAVTVTGRRLVPSGVRVIASGPPA